MIGFDSWTLCKVELLHSEIVISFLSPIENSSKIELKEKNEFRNFISAAEVFSAFLWQKREKKSAVSLILFSF